MAKLQCEVCGGKLVGKPGGIFECEYCGVEYSTEWAKAKIQEIKGTVKVEGTVDVKGTVKIDGPVEIKGSVTIDNLIKRGWMALEDRAYVDAKRHFEEAMNIDAQRSDCYFGLLCVYRRQPDVERLLKNEYGQIRTNKMFERAMALADEKTKQYIAELEQRFKKDQRAQQVYVDEITRELAPFRNRILPAQHLVCCTDKVVVALKPDGTLMTTTSGYLDRNDTEWCHNLCSQLKTWENIVALSASAHNVVGLKADGTVVAASIFGSAEDELDVSGWTDIVAIDSGLYRTLGLKKDRTVVAAGKGYQMDPLTKTITHDLSGWKDIAAISHLSSKNVGIRTDGTLVLEGAVRRDDEQAAEKIRQWKNIVAVGVDGGSTSLNTLRGLCADGTIINHFGERYGKDIVAICSSDYCLFALDKDGNVLKVYSPRKIENYLMGENVVAIVRQKHELVCLKADGTLIRRTTSGIKADFEGWKLFESVDTIEQERKQHAEEKTRREEKRREDAYEKAASLLNSGAGIEDLKYAQELFVSLKNYRDAEQQRKHCWNRIQELQLEEKYQNACALMNRDQIPEVGKAMQEFQKISAWKDSREKIGQCQEKIAYLKKRAEINKELSKVCSERDKLEKERSQLGIFSGKRKKELAAEIEKLDEEIARLEKQEKELK